MPEGPFFDQYISRSKAHKGLSSAQRSALLETTPLVTNGYTSSLFFCSGADLQSLGGPRGDNDRTAGLTKSLKARSFCFGQHKSICDDLYEDLMARQVTPEVVRTVVAEGSLEVVSQVMSMIMRRRAFQRKIRHLARIRSTIDAPDLVHLPRKSFQIQYRPGSCLKKFQADNKTKICFA